MLNRFIIQMRIDPRTLPIGHLEWRRVVPKEPSSSKFKTPVRWMIRDAEPIIRHASFAVLRNRARIRGMVTDRFGQVFHELSALKTPVIGVAYNRPGSATVVDPSKTLRPGPNRLDTKARLADGRGYVKTLIDTAYGKRVSGDQNEN